MEVPAAYKVEAWGCSQRLNNNYLYHLMHINNGAEIPSEDNRRTKPHSSQETAPAKYQLLALSDKESGSFQLWPSSPCSRWEPLKHPTYTQLAAQHLGGSIFPLLHL